MCFCVRECVCVCVQVFPADQTLDQAIAVATRTAAMSQPATIMAKEVAHATPSRTPEASAPTGGNHADDEMTGHSTMAWLGVTLTFNHGMVEYRIDGSLR